MELALISFHGLNTAATAFAAARDRAGSAARWPDRVGLVERHPDGHLVMRGTFAGHYVDVDEADHVSEAGAAEGWGIGALLGFAFGPPGLAAGSVLGAAVGSQIVEPSETEPEPKALADRLSTVLSASGSAVVLLGDPADVDEMLSAPDLGSGHVTRRTLTDDEVAILNRSLGDAPRV